MAAMKHRAGQYSAEKSSQKYLKTIGFTLGKTIGKGTYSKVCLATNENQKLACKIINRRNAGQEFIEKFLPRELKILRSIKHPHIVTIYHILDINNIVHIFMDFCKNGDLLEYIKNYGPLSETKAKMFFRQITSAVEYLHKHNLAHRDLKCENILLTSANKIKIADFGFARFTVNEEGESILSKTFCGSAAYAAPEILQGIAYDPKKIDIWALGCILYIMMSATMPFDDSNIKKMVKAQQNRAINTFMKFNWETSLSLKELMGNILEPEVSERADIEDIRYSAWLLRENYHGDKESTKQKSLSMLQVMM
ncbi:testis-specific serine/threonine-protein kinase 3-like [Coccinella septempunctata]|uniref:testis-specific serine/threonine-protein kinase 3-like n=1 Tax=Coccinella septempunctata TaxID=41139 RepID=UPI001D05FC75|nr:testis-specific serine/threonine-protein kinase 3-like [Coccinella septempunctata]